MCVCAHICMHAHTFILLRIATNLFMPQAIGYIKVRLKVLCGLITS